MSRLTSWRQVWLCAAWMVLPFVAGIAQSSLYDIGQIQRIELQFSQPNWDYRMDTAKLGGSETLLLADWVKINGIQYDSVGVKYKGNSSFDSSQVKNPVHIALDEYKNQSHQGYATLKLGNGYADPSLIREVLAYDLLQHYMHCPKANFAQLYINGSYIGLYSNPESIAKEFCSDHFYSSSGTFFKCNPTVIPGPTTKSNLKALVGDSTAYFTRYELKSGLGWNELVDLTTVVTNNSPTLGAAMDMDRVVWMLAFNDVTVNLDSYSGVFCQNYYIYKDRTDHFNPIVWDLNMSFGGFPFLGAGNTSLGSLDVTGRAQLPVDIHNGDPYWPLMNDVYGNARYRKMYYAHLRTMTDEMIASGAYATTAAALMAQVDTAVVSDNNKFFTYNDFQNALTTDVPNGSYTVPGIQSLMTARLSYLQSTTPFGYAQPSIANVLPAPAAPALHDTVVVTATVTNADSVFLGYRLDQTLKFLRVPMADDGLHGDGASNDGLYGAQLLMAGAEAQYYVYAENADIGAFSPARAEHEFYSLQAALSLPQPGDLVINEFLATNTNGQTDETGQFEDWIELYNTTAGNLSLTGLYLSDNALNRSKWAFPTGTVLAPHSLLMVWADEDSSTSSYLHCNFKLSAFGEEILLSDGGSLTLDSIVYAAQTANVSMGRCPDGAGSLSPRSTPTFNALNCGLGAEAGSQIGRSLKCFPVPATSTLQVVASHSFKGALVVRNMLGTVQYAAPWTGDAALLVTDWVPGIYFVQLGDVTTKIVVTH